MRRIDLHLHTRASDGTETPAETVRQARELGLSAIALTDHDTVAGVAEAVAAGRELGVEVVPGIEVSSDYRDNNIHVLGYFIDIDAPALRRVLDWVSVERAERNERLVAMLAADGFDITLEALEAAYPNAVLGRPHIAEYMVKKGYVSSVTEGFDRYLEVGRKYFLPKRRIPFADAIETIRAAGGVAVLAHPLQYHYPLDEVVEFIALGKSCGAQALECYYSEYSPEEQAWMLSQAEAFGMGVSGGSDWHGTRKTHIAMGSGMGGLCVPYSVLEGLRAIHDSDR